MLYSNGTSSEVGLDGYGRLGSLVNRAVGGGVMSQLHVSYDAVGNITRVDACGTGDDGAGVTPDPAAGFRAS